MPSKLCIIVDVLPFWIHFIVVNAWKGLTIQGDVKTCHFSKNRMKKVKLWKSKNIYQMCSSKNSLNYRHRSLVRFKTAKYAACFQKARRGVSFFRQLPEFRPSWSSNSRTFSGFFLEVSLHPWAGLNCTKIKVKNHENVLSSIYPASQLGTWKKSLQKQRVSFQIWSPISYLSSPPKNVKKQIIISDNVLLLSSSLCLFITRYFPLLVLNEIFESGMWISYLQDTESHLASLLQGYNDAQLYHFHDVHS